MKVYGTAGTQEGMDFILKQGANAVFSHKEEGYADKIVVHNLYNKTSLNSCGHKPKLLLLSECVFQ